MNTLIKIFSFCCPNPNKTGHVCNSVKRYVYNDKDEIQLSLEETFSTDNIKNVNSINSSNVKFFENAKDQIIFSPKFNEDILYSPHQFKELITYTKESKKYENSSYKYSEFTFNNGKDNSMCNLNTYVLESDNSSRVNNIHSYPNNIILDHEVKSNKRLVLSVCCSFNQDELGEFLFNKILTITAAGLENGLRNKRDGYTYFGEKEKFDDTIVNDFIINYKMENVCNKSLFLIVYRRSINHYKIDSQKYHIKNTEDTTKNDRNLIYIKLNMKYEIKSKKFFFIGDCLFFVEPLSDEENESKINLEFYSKNYKEKYEFNYKHSPITIGRKDCKINIKSTIFSKNQSTLIYEKNKWFICDGFEEKRSTNGSWLLLDDEFEICYNTSIKIGPNIIKIEIV